MTGAGLVSVSGIDVIVQLLSKVGSHLPVAGPPLSNSYSMSASRHTPRAAHDLTIGIRGATPPPAG